MYDKIFALQDEPKPGRTPIVRTLADVQTRSIEWLWPFRLAIGKLNLIAGHPGESKSLLSIDIASRVTKGTPFVDCIDRPNHAGDVIVLTAEDDLADTWKPRFVAAGGNPAHVHALEAIEVTDFNEKTGLAETHRRGFSLDADLERLESVIQQARDPRLLILDPVSCYMGSDTDAHSNTDVRAVLAPLADLAARHRLCVVAVHHLNKTAGQSAMHRVTGSLAFTAAARTAWLVCRDPTPNGDPRRRLFLQLKSNLAGDIDGLAYRIETDPNGVAYLSWFPEPVAMRADEALAVVTTKSRATSRKDAEEWLRNPLADGPVDADEVRKDAEAAGIKEKTLWRGKGSLGVISVQCGYGKGKRSLWQLPDTESNSGHFPPYMPNRPKLDNGDRNWENESRPVGELAGIDESQFRSLKTNSGQLVKYREADRNWDGDPPPDYHNDLADSQSQGCEIPNDYNPFAAEPEEREAIQAVEAEAEAAARQGVQWSAT